MDSIKRKQRDCTLRQGIQFAASNFPKLVDYLKMVCVGNSGCSVFLSCENIWTQN